MIDKFSQVAENLPAADRDADRQYHVINGYPVVFSFSKEPNPEAFERMRLMAMTLYGVGVSTSASMNCTNCTSTNRKLP